MRAIFRPLALTAAFLLAAGVASATPVTLGTQGSNVFGTNGYRTGTITPGGGVAAGGFAVEVTSGDLGIAHLADAFTAFCLDIGHRLSLPSSYQVTTTPFAGSPLSSAQQGAIRALFNTGYNPALLGTANFSAGFQLALWRSSTKRRELMPLGPEVSGLRDSTVLLPSPTPCLATSAALRSGTGGWSICSPWMVTITACRTARTSSRLRPYRCPRQACCCLPRLAASAWHRAAAGWPDRSPADQDGQWAASPRPPAFHCGWAMSRFGASQHLWKRIVSPAHQTRHRPHALREDQGRGAAECNSRLLNAGDANLCFAASAGIWHKCGLKGARLSGALLARWRVLECLERNHSGTLWQQPLWQ